MSDEQKTSSTEVKQNNDAAQTFYVERRAEAMSLDAVRAYAKTTGGSLPPVRKAEELSRAAFELAHVFGAVAFEHRKRGGATQAPSS